MNKPALPNETLKEPLLLKLPEAAALLAISPRKLWEMTNSGQIPHLRIGRAVRYSIEDLREWIKSQQV
jgi:excisionase family DNA binding protein